MPERVGLSRTSIVAAAIGLADREGLERLSMRRLGQELGVEAMSLYHHMPNKSALLDAMVDVVLARIDIPSSPNWRIGLQSHCRSQRASFGAHRWALAVYDSRSTPGLPTLQHHDAVLGYLRSHGFSPRAAGHAYALLDAFVMGFAMQEQSLPFDADTAPSMASSMFPAGSEAELPHLGEFLREVILAGGYDFGDEFEVGLDLLLDALATLRT